MLMAMTKHYQHQEIRGYNAFRGFVGRCSQCHVPPSFSDSQLAVVGAPAGPQGYVDPGAGAFTDDADLTGAFRVPSLRNATLTAPYFHSGQFGDLSSVARFLQQYAGARSASVSEAKYSLACAHGGRTEAL
jgi:cytochrome c peroxidase